MYPVFWHIYQKPEQPFLVFVFPIPNAFGKESTMREFNTWLMAAEDVSLARQDKYT